MWIIYGARHYGQIDTRGGQFQLTRFAHVFWLPLVPIGTLWVTGQVGGGLQGHTVAWSARSVLAGYARSWGPIVALVALLQLSLLGLGVALCAASLTAWTWTWYAVRGERAQRRSDYHLEIYGTRCDPLRMPRQLAFSLRSEVDRRWAEAGDGHPLEEVAQVGTRDPAQAVLAYAALRLAARTANGPQAISARRASEKLLDQASPPPPA